MTSKNINLFDAIKKVAANEELTEFLGKTLELCMSPFQDCLNYRKFQKLADYDSYWENIKQIENNLIFNNSLLIDQEQIIIYCQAQLLKEQKKTLNSLYHPEILKANVYQYYEKYNFLVKKYDTFLSTNLIFIKRKDFYKYEVRYDLEVCKFYGLVYSLFNCYLDTLKTTVNIYAPELSFHNPNLSSTKINNFENFLNEKYKIIERYTNRLSNINDERLKLEYEKMLENECNQLYHELKFTFTLPAQKYIGYLKSENSIHTVVKYLPTSKKVEIKTWNEITTGLLEACDYAELYLSKDDFERSIAMNQYTHVYDIFFKNNIDILQQNIKDLAKNVQKELSNIGNSGTLQLLITNYNTDFEEIIKSINLITLKLNEVKEISSINDEESLLMYENFTFLNRLNNLLDLFFECFDEMLKKYTIKEKFIQSEEDEITDIKFKNLTQKISLLDQLGVIDFLKNKYPILKDNNSKLASLLGGILEITDKTGKETLRKNLSYLDPNHKKTIRNKKSDIEIRAELLKLGIVI